jgi:branched-chain amino acid transport system ATP-binding protein
MWDIRNEQASNLPQGSLRALGIAIGLATDPKVLLLDEPFAGMNHDETYEHGRFGALCAG